MCLFRVDHRDLAAIAQLLGLFALLPALIGSLPRMRPMGSTTRVMLHSARCWAFSLS